MRSRLATRHDLLDEAAFDKADAKLLQELRKGSGVGNGVRTRDFRSHSPALYR